MIEPKEITIGCIGYEIKADWYQGDDSVGVMLFLIGFPSKKSTQTDLVTSQVTGTGMSAIVLEYSGFGESEFDLNEVSPAQNFIEVVQVFDWIKDHKKANKICVIGTSYGAFQATQLSEYRKFEKLVLRVPAIYPPEIFYTKWKNIDREYVDQYRNNFEDYKSHPLLVRASHFPGETFTVIHEIDESCPLLSTQAFTSAFGAEEYIAEKFKHSPGNSDITREELVNYQEVIVDWLNK